MNFRDVELLSAYLDGRLKPSDAARLETRLSSDASLKATLEELRDTRTLLRRLPQRRAPRDFRLTAKMAGIRPPQPRAYPVFRFATALAALLLVASVALNVVTPFAASRLAAPAAAPLGMGGGMGGGGGGGGDGTVEAPAAAPFAALAPTATPEGTLTPQIATTAPSAEDAARAATEATEQANKSAPFESQPAAPASPQPIPLGWMIALAVVMLVSAAATWLLRINNERRIRARWKQK